MVNLQLIVYPLTYRASIKVVDLTPLIPLSLRRRGGNKKREASPLLDSLLFFGGV